MTTKECAGGYAPVNEMCQGEHFMAFGYEWICLDIIDGNYLAITAEVWVERPFDKANRNNWAKSSIRAELDAEFLADIDREKYLAKQTSDMIADNGDKAYGTCEDYITILSCDQYRKYRDYVPLYPEWMWTLTPWSCDKDYTYGPRVVSPTGIVSHISAMSGHGVAPACLFKSEHLSWWQTTTE